MTDQFAKTIDEEPSLDELLRTITEIDFGDDDWNDDPDDIPERVVPPPRPNVLALLNAPPCSNDGFCTNDPCPFRHDKGQGCYMHIYKVSCDGECGRYHPSRKECVRYIRQQNKPRSTMRWHVVAIHALIVRSDMIQSADIRCKNHHDYLDLDGDHDIYRCPECGWYEGELDLHVEHLKKFL